jgi:SAM-dependent methyltransferase
VLDLGAGAGRHSLHLQSLGHRVTAVDTSPGAVEVCRARGIGDVRLADLTKLVDERTWDTILLMCGNLGLAGDWEPTRRLLMRLRKRASRGGILIGDSVDPTSDDPIDLAYEERNRVYRVPSNVTQITETSDVDELDPTGGAGERPSRRRK